MASLAGSCAPQCTCGHLRMAVRSPGEESPHVIVFNALPFGAVGSVAGFLRVSLAVWFIGVAALQLCWAALYDDSSVLSRSELLDHTSWRVESRFQLLGLRCANEGKKFLPCDKKFEMLGLEVNLEECQNKCVSVGHTVDRCAEFISKIDDILAADFLGPKEAERRRGRMVFFEGYTFGRLANAASKNLGKVLRSAWMIHSGGVCCCWIGCSVHHQCALVRIGRPLADTWIVFTDGACNPEQQQGSIGGLIISRSGICSNFFSDAVPFDILQQFFAASQNPIHELEVLPVFIACLLWDHHYAGAFVVYYIDHCSQCRDQLCLLHYH
eukprot:s2625_g5.t1